MEQHSKVRVRHLRPAMVVATVGLIIVANVVVAHDSAQAGIQSSEDFAALLNEISTSTAEAQPQLMYRVADLPDSDLKGTVATIPLASYEVDAKSNAIGLQNVHYTVASDRDGSNLRLLRVQFYFVSGEKGDRSSCAQFDEVRTALGLDATVPAVPMPFSNEIVSSRTSGKSMVFVSTDASTKPCLRSVFVQFHDALGVSSSNRGEDTGSRD